MYNAANASREESKRRYCKSEALAAVKSKIVLVNHAVIHSLARALSVSKGQKNTCCGKEAFNYKSCYHSDSKAKNRLYQICRNRSHTRVEYFTRALFCEPSARRFEGRRNKSKRQCVIGYYLKVGNSVSAENFRLKNIRAGYSPAHSLKYQNYYTSKHRGRNQ